MQYYRCSFLSERGRNRVGRVAEASLFRARPQYHGIDAIEHAIKAWDEKRRVIYRARDAA